MYATLDFTKDILAAYIATGASITKDDQRLLQAIRSVSSRFDGLFPQTPRWPILLPTIGARYKPITEQRVDTNLNTFSWREHLLELTSVTVNGEALVVGTDVELWPDSTQPPFTRLRLIDRWRSWYNFCPSCDVPPLVALTGVWGFTRDYANVWQQVDTLDAAIADGSVMQFMVTDINGVDQYGLVPRLSAGNFCKVGDEYMEVIQTDPTTNIGQWRRGMNGSTAVGHSKGDPVYVWQQMDEIQRAVARQAAMEYARRGAFTTVQVQGMTEVRYPSDWLIEARAVLESLNYA